MNPRQIRISLCSKRSSEGGFTLVAVILVVSLLTVLVVSATVVSQIEQQAQYNSSRQEVARQNALFGLNQALNQLQTAVGPDRRVTARADILTSNLAGSNLVTNPISFGYSNNVPAADAGESFWTGVWRNTSNDYAGCAGNGLTATPNDSPGQTPGPGGNFFYYDYLPNGLVNQTAPTTPLSATTIPSRSQLYYNSNNTSVPSNVTWLVSWPPTTTPPNMLPDPTQKLTFTVSLPTRSSTITLSGTSDTNGTSPEFVKVISNLNIKTNQNYTKMNAAGINSVYAPKVPILATQIGTTKQVAVGTFAYWVADEGIKAKTDGVDPYITPVSNSPLYTAFAETQAHFQISQSSAVAQPLDSPTANSAWGFSGNTVYDNRNGVVVSPTLPAMAYSDTSSSWGDFQSHPSTYSPDFTVSSYGVIADNFNGGLREDLTAAFENYFAYQYLFGDAANNPNGTPSFTEAARKLYSVNAITGQPLVYDSAGGTISGPTDMVLDGLRWDSLFYYYNLYHGTMPSPVKGGSPSPSNLGYNFGIGYTGLSNECSGTIPTLPARIYREVNPANINGAALDMDGLCPVLMSYSIVFSIGFNQIAGAPNQYNFIASSSPTLIEYNPFDVNLAKPSGAYDLLAAQDGISGGGLFQTTQTVNVVGGTTVAGGPTPTPTPIPFNYKFAFHYDSNMQTQAETSVTPFFPGELRAYGLSKSNLVGNSGAEEDPGGNAQVTIPTPTFPTPTPSPTPNPSTTPTPTTAPTATPGPTFATPSGRGGSPNFMQFVPPSTYTIGTTALTSNNCSDQFCQYEIIPMTYSNLTVMNPSSATVYFGGSTIMAPYQPIFSQINYPLWPSSNSVGSSSSSSPSPLKGYGTGEISSSNMGNDSPAPTTQLIGTVSSLTVSAGTAPTNLPVLVKYIDRACGLNCTAFLPHDRLPSGTVQMSLPGMAAGGALLNPLDSDLNGFSRDHSGSYVYSGVPDSTNDLNGSNNMSSGNQVFDTNWLPDSVGKGVGFNQPILYPVPRQPLLSLGQFKNMYCHYSALFNGRYGSGGGKNRLLGFSFYTLGGSYQAGLNPNVAFATPTTMGDGNLLYSALLDDNFLANETLFDGYFLSTVPPSNLVDYQNWPVSYASSFNQTTIDSNQPLPDSRLVYYYRSQPNRNPQPNSNSPNIADLQCPNSTTAYLRAPAANLLINGAFNVNSTSVPAWTALLTSTSFGKSLSATNNKLQLFLNSPSSGLNNCVLTSQTFSNSETPFLNFSRALGVGNSSWSGSADNNVAFFSFVDMKTTTAQTLAQNIVTQVLKRGPFLSIGDFLNHRLNQMNPPASLQYLSNSGALQAAIDMLTINSVVEGQTVNGSATAIGASSTTSSTQVTTSIAGSTGYVNNILPSYPQNSAAGIPGTLMQNDLVQAIAPALSTRSDTFTVRFYGQALSPTGGSEAEAYGEAVIQRVPEFVYSSESGILDPSNKADFAYDDLNASPLVANKSGVNGLTPENYAFGRRFKIISIRWLNKNEI